MVYVTQSNKIIFSLILDPAGGPEFWVPSGRALSVYYRCPTTVQQKNLTNMGEYVIELHIQKKNPHGAGLLSVPLFSSKDIYLIIKDNCRPLARLHFQIGQKIKLLLQYNFFAANFLWSNLSCYDLLWIGFWGATIFSDKYNYGKYSPGFLAANTK